MVRIQAKNCFTVMDNGEKKVYSLHGHARNNNVEEMIKLLNSRENVNAKDKLLRFASLCEYELEHLSIWLVMPEVWMPLVC